MAETAVSARRDARRDAILEVAREVFFEEGYAAASMSTIAARLGGSKGTLYNYFKSKEELFEFLVRETCSRFGGPVFDLLVWRDGSDLDGVRHTLTEFGQQFLQFLLSEVAMRTFQLVTAEARRSPELGRIFYEAGPQAAIARMTGYLEAARTAGLIDPSDCQVAAEQLIALFRGHIYLRVTLNLISRPTPEQSLAEVEHAVALFIKAHGVSKR